MKNHKARFRGDIQVDGSILGPDGEPIDLGGGSVDLTHLTELAFGDDSLTELRLLTDAEAEGYYATPGTGFHINRTLVVDDPDYNGVMVVNSDAWPVESDYEQAGADMYVGYNGGNFAAWAPDTVHPGNYKRVAIGADYGFTRISSLPTDKFLNAYVGIEANPRFKAEIDGSMHWGDGTANDAHLKRTAPGTLELDHILSFKSLVDNTTEGVTLSWDEDFWGLVVKGRPGSGDSELYVVDPDDPGYYSNISIGSIDLAHGGGFGVGQTLGIGPSGLHFHETNWTFHLDQFGRMQWGPGDAVIDTHLKRRAAGVLELEENGGGLVLHSPDGTAYKISVANGGALSAVAV